MKSTIEIEDENEIKLTKRIKRGESVTLRKYKAHNLYCYLMDYESSLAIKMETYKGHVTFTKK